MASRIDASEGRRQFLQDRLATTIGVIGIIVAAWLYLVVGAPRTMQMGATGMSASMHAMSQVQVWSSSTYFSVLVMWIAMMIAMMVPSAVPTVLLYTAVARKARLQDNPIPPTFVFVAGYVLAWAAFCVIATGAQGALGTEGLLSPQMSSNSTILAGTLVLAAGIYQLTPIKSACLKNCRSPAHFLSRHWQQGSIGALRMGIVNGVYCLGCCWVLMVVLFVGGVMNLLWVAAIALFVLLEKTFPFGAVAGRVAGAAMVSAGALTLAGVASFT